MNEIKKLGDIKDMERYLEEDCYCSGEIYSFDGFFYQIFNVNSECKYIGRRTGHNSLTTDNETCLDFVISKSGKPDDLTYKPQILMVASKNDKISDIIRVDATDNNIRLVKEIIKSGKSELKFNEYEEGSTQRSIDKIMEMADAIMID